MCFNYTAKTSVLDLTPRVLILTPSRCLERTTPIGVKFTPSWCYIDTNVGVRVYDITLLGVNLTPHVGVLIMYLTPGGC